MKSANLLNSTYLMKYLQLPYWQQWIIGISLACLPLLIIYCVVVLPAQEQQITLQQEQQTLASQLNQLTQHYNKLPKVDELTQRIDILTPSRLIELQPNDQQDNFTKVITHYLNQSHSQLVLLNNLTSEQNEFFTTQKWQLKLAGEYTQLFQFMTLLIESDHLLTIEQFQLEKVNEQLNLAFIIQLYYAVQYHHE